MTPLSASTVVSGHAERTEGSCRTFGACIGWRACCWPNARLLTLQFLPLAERLKTWQEVHLRFRPGASMVVVHHRLPGEVPVRDP